MTYSYVCHDSFIFGRHDSFIHVPWLINMCAMTHPYVCVACLINVCDMTHSSGNQRQRHKRHTLMRHTTHINAYMTDSKRNVYMTDWMREWLIADGRGTVCGVTNLCVRHDSMMHRMTHWCVWHDLWHRGNVCDVTHSCVGHDLFTCVTWIMLICDTTHSCVERFIFGECLPATYPNVGVRAHTQSRTHTYAHTRTQTHTHTYAHACMRARTHRWLFAGWVSKSALFPQR